MNFKSKFGLGEIVARTIEGGSEGGNRDRCKVDDLLEVVQIAVCKEGQVVVFCRHTGGFVTPYAESDLEGDPEFNQETGTYSPDINSK